MIMKYIDDKIIEIRQRNLPTLEKEKNKINQEVDLLEQIKGKLLSLNPEFKKEKIDSLIKDLETEKIKIENIISRWKSGVIKIAVAGLEKAGKTTFLNNIINNNIVTLPAFAERCTATLCEIEHSLKEKAILSFFREEEFVEKIIIPDIEELNKNKNLEVKINIPKSIIDFNKIELPNENTFETGTTSKMILSRLHEMQNKSDEFQNYLGSRNKEISIEEVKNWVAHKEGTSESNAKSIAIERCTVYTKIADGDVPLVLLDTPGVNDPNPRARRRTLELVEKEADLLLFMSRPGNQPSPTREFQQFVSDIRSFDSTVSVQDFQLYILNDDKRVQDSDMYLEKHKHLLLEKPYEISPEKIIEVNATDYDSIKACFSKINEFLFGNLKNRDYNTIQKINESIHHLDDNIFSLLDKISKDIPDDREILIEEIKEYEKRFNDFFAYIEKSTKELINQIENDKSIKDYHDQMRKKLFNNAKEIYDNIPSYKELLERALKTPDGDPYRLGCVEYALPQINKLINSLTYTLKDFGKTIQAKFVELISNSPLQIPLKGEDNRTKIISLITLFQEIFEGTDIGATEIESLKDILNSADNINKTFRWELRPAVYCVNYQYKKIYPDKFKKLISKYKLGNSSNNTQPAQESLGDDIIQALSIMKFFIKNQQYDLGAIASDIIANWYFSMIYNKKEAWKEALKKKIKLILPERCDFRNNSEKNKEVRDIINNLSKTITSKTNN